jgi:hypothetical protein
MKECGVEPRRFLVQRQAVMTRVLLLLVPLALSACVNFRTEPIEVKPIHITVDVNVKVDKALDDFFGDLDRKSATRAY